MIEDEAHNQSLILFCLSSEISHLKGRNSFILMQNPKQPDFKKMINFVPPKCNLSKNLPCRSFTNL